MKRGIPFAAFFLTILFLTGLSFAHDTDLYMSSGEGVEPNILVIFDNSGSMNDPAPDYVYDTSKTYAALVVPQSDRDKVYYKSGTNWYVYKNSISSVVCPTARTYLTNRGHYEGYPQYSDCRKHSKSDTYYTLRTGNYRNFLADIGEANENLPKLNIAKRVINDFLDTVNGVRIGFMVFNSLVYVSGVSESEGGHIQSTVKSLTDTNREQLKADVTNILAETWTPLAETLYEAGLYFKGGASYFNPGVVYTSPIQYHCQRNYIILITDGNSTRDRNSILSSAIGDRDGDGREPGGAHEAYYDSLGTDYLDDVAKHLYETDLSPSFEGQQNIITYTIGFTISSAHNLLERTAAHGHGKYFYCEDALGLADSFQNIVDDILAKSTSFVAPIVPVSRMERTTAGDKIYFALFKPIRDGMWHGNIKKFGVAQADNPLAGIILGDIIDVNGDKALADNGQFKATARSFWTTVNQDGGEVNLGGAGEVLQGRTTSRNLYTYMGSNTTLTHSSNAFATANALITPATLGLESTNTEGRDKLIQFVHGADAYDDDSNGNATETRSWILGSFLHSRPFLIHYASRSVIFAGSNDGMLHAIDDSNGEELWGFIPPNLLNKLQALHADVLESFVDGSPKAYITRNSSGDVTKAILIFGQRRGGNRYFALDVTDPQTPKYLWEINPELTDSPYAEMGQTWSSPSIGKIHDGTPNGKWVMIIGGGYDDNQDNDTPGADTKGRAVYVVDILTGAKIWRHSNAEDGTNMIYSIPSDVTKLDVDGDGKIDRFYVGDMGGRMWRFDIGDPDPSNWQKKIIFKSNVSSGDGRKIFYPPEVTLENDSGNYEMIFFGTGDREHPKETTTVNRIYGVKDKNLADKVPPTPYMESDLVDVTSNILQDPGQTQGAKNSVLAQLKEKNGWFIRFDASSGEKTVSTSVVYSRVAYFSTFSPTVGVDTDPCYVGEGTARIYALDYKNGNAILNLDLTNDVSGQEVIRTSDRLKVVGTAIPSGVIITFIGGKAVAYTGVGGGVYRPGLRETRSIVPVNWRSVF